MKVTTASAPSNFKATYDLPSFINRAHNAIAGVMKEEFPLRAPYVTASDEEVEKGLLAFGRFQRAASVSGTLAIRVAVVFAGFAAEMRVDPSQILRPGATIEDFNWKLARFHVQIYQRRSGYVLVNLRAAQRIIDAM